VVEREALRDPAAHGDAHDVRPDDPKGVEQADGIRDEVRAPYGGAPGS
jgi:hypothetical protein